MGMSIASASKRWMATEAGFRALPEYSIARLQPEQLPRLVDLLDSNGLPSQDCAERSDIFYGIIDRGRLIAAGGLEPAAEFALLRSLVVHPRYRGRGLARLMTEFLIAQAQAQGSQAIYLLTETAADYFEHLGFCRVSRDRVPAAIMRTRQFASLCPDSASCLLMRLPPN